MFCKRNFWNGGQEVGGIISFPAFKTSFAMIGKREKHCVKDIF